MGMINSDGQWICCLYDLGMARIYTDADGYVSFNFKFFK
jgi:hypothetical protein